MENERSKKYAEYYSKNFFSAMIMHTVFLTGLLFVAYIFIGIPVNFFLGGFVFIFMIIANFIYMKVKNSFHQHNLFVNSFLMILLVEYIVVLNGGYKSPLFCLFFFLPIALALVFGKKYAYYTLFLLYLFYFIFSLLFTGFPVPNSVLDVAPLIILIITGPFGSLMTERYIDVENEKLIADREKSKAKGFAEELSDAYKKLQTLDDAKSDFISIASHQLRTPLSIIKGYLSMLKESDYGKVNDEQKRIINMSINALNDLNGIVNEILMSSRIEKGTFTITKAPADMIEIIKYIRDLYENKYKEKGLDFKVILPKGVSKLEVNIDRDKFEQVIINLIENAYNYTLKGSVVITLEAKPKTFKIAFKDTGIGIAKDDYGKLFEKFVRLDNAQKIRPDGTGIGLYTAKVIVETHGGKIWFESEEGKGTTFFVEMPKT